MTPEEFERDWEKYAIELIEKSNQILALKDVFEDCTRAGEILAFRIQNGVSDFCYLKCDKDGFCYRLKRHWKIMGRLVLLEELAKNPENMECLERGAESFWMKLGGAY